MTPFSDCKFVEITRPINNSSDTTAFTTNEVDTKGFRWLTVIMHMGATDGALTVWKVQESDTSGSGMADITGLVASGTTGDGRLPTATDDGGIFMFNINLAGRKRYLDVGITTGDVTTGTLLGCIGVLSRAEEAPNTTAERGLSGYLCVPA